MDYKTIAIATMRIQQKIVNVFIHSWKTFKPSKLKFEFLNWKREMESNHRPRGYEPRILPLNYPAKNWSEWMESNHLNLVPKTSDQPMNHTPSEITIYL